MSLPPRSEGGASAVLTQSPPGSRVAGRTKPSDLPEFVRPLSILSFNYEYPPVGGGGGVFHEQIAEELAKRHHVDVVTSAFGDLPSHEVRRGVEIYRVPIFGRHDPSAASLRSMLAYPPAAWVVAGRLLRRRRYDLIHSHFAVPTGPASIPPAMVAHIPHVLTIQGGDIYDPSKRLSPHRNAVLRAVVTAVMRHSSAVVAASRNIVENAYRYFNYRGPIERIPLAIRPPPAVPPASRSSLGLAEGAFLAVTIGRLVKRKCLDQLIRALARPECATVHLAVIGSGPEMESLRLLTQSLSLTDRVRFLGRIGEMEKWQILNSADLYVSASMHEGFGLVYLEAMACGLPVVAPDHGGQTDFLLDGESGYVVVAGDLQALIEGLAHAVRQRGETRLMGEKNRVRVREYYIERCARSYESLFSRVLRAAGRRGVGSRVDSAVTRSLGVLFPITDPDWIELTAGLAPLLAG